MTSISKNGSEWLGLMREFIEVAADAAKIARAKNNPDELYSIGKKVGSDYSLNNRQLSCVYKTGFSALAARPFAARAASTTSFLWLGLGSNQVPVVYKTTALPMSYERNEAIIPEARVGRHFSFFPSRDFF